MSKGARLNSFQHALLRPDTYIGNVKTQITKVWVFNDELNSAILKNVRYNIGLFNIVREIISNSIDNVWRSKEESPDNLVKKICIYVKKETGEISVWNDGYCIPVHKENYTYTDARTNKTINENMYPAEIYFGDMFSGTNYDDTKSRKTSGRNGMGAKATNVFSKEFKVEHSNPEDKKIFTQTYKNNGTERSVPEIKSYKLKTGYTQISFTPDYEYFKYPGNSLSGEEDEIHYGIDENFIQLLKLYAHEVSMITEGLCVKFFVDDNETNIKISSLERYVRLFYPSIEEHKLFCIVSPHTNDECVLVETDPPDIEEQETISHISFVNGIRTKDGGVHVNAWKDTFISAFVKSFNQRKLPNEKIQLKVSAKQVYPYLQLFIRCEADRPKFSSQTKDELTEIFDEHGNSVNYTIFDSKKKKDKDEWNLVMENSIKKMMKWNFILLLEEKLLSRIDRSLSRDESNQKRISDNRYYHANEAGPKGKNAEECVLHITEGLSAGALVVRGTTRDKNGALAVRGKFLNIQNASTRDINSNEEIKLIKNVLNLKRGVDYSLDENFKTLNYGKVCIMTDADDDGIHIRGLLINYFYKEYPYLIERGYIISLSTAVVVVFFKNAKTDKKLFFSNPEFKKWFNDCSEAERDKIKDVKYYKGLGSIRPDDALECFDNPKIVNYFLQGTEEELMDIGFNNKSSDKRKVWILRSLKSTSPKEEEIIISPEENFIENAKTADSVVDDENYIYEGPLSISNFVDKQLIIYHRMALRRSLPGIWDGFKECQRKIFYAIRLRNYKKTLDLEKIMGAVKEITGYKHGGAALLETITKMAQGFVGRNNIPLFVNDGEFGTRSGVKGPGGDHAASRYISTMEEDVSRCVFSSLDDDLLVRLYEDNDLVEYDFYMPVVPMLLINGSEGIGCGWSTTIPNYNPLDLVEWIREWINGNEKELEKLKPWYRGFKGDISLIKDKITDEVIAWSSRGILEKGETGNAWHIRELPVGVWTKQPFEEWLTYLYDGTMPKDKKWKKSSGGYIKKILDYSGANHVHYEIEPSKDFIPDMDTPSNLGIMQSRESLKNMIAIDEHNYPHRFSSPEEYMYIFCPKRLEYYEKRKNHMLRLWNIDLKKSTNKYIFVKGVVDKKLNLYRSDEELNKILSEKPWKFDKIENASSKEPSYDYLLSMQMRSMTIAKLEELNKEKEKINIQIHALNSKNAKDLWEEDLKKFENAYAKFLTTRCEEKERVLSKAGGKKKIQIKKRA